MYSTYSILDNNQDYIDKTNTLEKGITVFPSIYIEGAAVCGKTTAVKMLLSNHPETTYTVFDIKRYQSEESLFCLELAECLEKMSFKSHWVIFENLHTNSSETLTEVMVDFIWQLPADGRAVFVSREKPPEAFLELLWKQQMTLCRQQALLFSCDEVGRFIQKKGCALNVQEVYARTGGWAGCVSVLVRLSLLDEEENTRRSVDEYMSSYEMQAFIRKEIIDTLGAKEKDMVRLTGLCPWADQRLCSEVWGMHNSSDTMASLVRKGLLLYDAKSGRWKLAPIVRFCSMDEISDTGLKAYKENNSESAQMSEFWKCVGLWYEKNGHIQEALHCLKKMNDQKSYQRCIAVHFSEIPFSGIDFSDVMMWQEDMPEVIYLRGMYCYMNQNFAGLDREIKKIEGLHKKENVPGQDGICREVYMNLTYVSPDKTLDEWLSLLEESGNEAGRLHLYHVLGNSPIAICGLRDLSGLFGCPLKEEKRKEKIWKSYLDEDAWKFYQMARMDFYMETLRSEAISTEDREVLFGSTVRDEPWQMSLVRYYLLCKYQKIHQDDNNYTYIHKWKETLENQDNDVCKNITEAVGSLYEVMQNEGKTLNQWIRYSAPDWYGDINEENFSILCLRAKGYLLINQYNKAKKLLRVLIPYAKGFRRSRFVAELLFQEAIVNLSEGNQGQTLRSTIESFLTCGSSRYVEFYTVYGKKGLEVMERYIDWVHSNAPEGWSRKKKYNYGNVVRMPVEDYLDVILRRTRKKMRTYPQVQSLEVAEKLTMMETMVLQELGRGMTNVEICQSLNLKITTVKSHIYSIYKKLGVSSRVQAVLKGKELGIIQ